MICCDLEKIDAKDMPVGKLIGIVAKAQMQYYNDMLDELNINNSQLHILFEISNESNINQDRIASRCNTDKGSIARSIRKLEDNGFITRTIDENNRRQNMISLTDKGIKTLEKSKEIVENLENHVFDDIEDKHKLQLMLKDVALKIMELNEERMGENE
jgi:DNA-binding MarR family transcriptional regulator